MGEVKVSGGHADGRVSVCVCVWFQRLCLACSERNERLLIVLGYRIGVFPVVVG